MPFQMIPITKKITALYYIIFKHIYGGEASLPNSLSTSFYRQEIYEAAKLTKAEVTILHRKAKVFSFIEKDSW